MMNHYLRTRFLILSALLVSTAGIHLCRAQGTLPFLNGPNNAGREFWVAFPANWDMPSAPQYYIRLYVMSSMRTRVRVWVGANIKKTFYTKAGGIDTVDLSPIEAQMFTRSDVAPVPADQIYIGRALHVDADAPIVLYGINRTSYTSDGMLVLPTNALGRNYIVASYAAVIGGTQELPSQLMVIAPYNNTTVTIDQPMGTPNHTAGQTVTLTMNRGDVYSAMTLGYGGDMSGAVIHSNKPVAVTAGQACTYIPNQINFCCCDHLSEMMLPTHAWGTKYQAVPLATRMKGDFYRVFAGADSAVVSINGAKYTTLLKAGGGEGLGWFEYRAETKDPVEFTANKPIMVAQYNPSQAYDNVPSDPFYQVLMPVEQFSTSLLFATPGADFPQNYINLVVDSATYHQVEMAPAGTNNWTPVWQNSGAGTPHAFPTPIHGRTYAGVSVEIAPGSYQLRAPRPLGGYIYGFSAYDSYGFPLAATTCDLNSTSGVPPTLAPKIVHSVGCNGIITASVTSADPGDDRALLSSIDVIADSDTTANVSRDISAYQTGSPSASVSFNVVKPQQRARAVLVAADMQGNVAFDTIYYEPAGSLESRGFDFGSLALGVTGSGTITISNPGVTVRYITSITLLGDTTQFSIEKLDMPLVLGPGQSRTIDVWFTPATSRAFEARIQVSDSCSSAVICKLSGSGQVVAGVSVSPAPLPTAFTLMPNQTRGARVTAHLTLGAASTVTIAILDNAGAVVAAPIELPVAMEAGEHDIPIEVSGLAVGRYYCRVVCGSTVLAQPLTVTR
ncbi:MAG: hypothetical protein JST22_14255 [Bacteroidetes bacterium]|nr:hypothetical protein [Bacteroidota bacterium]